MRILFVAMADSVHTARWINQTVDQGWDVHLFSARDFEVHPELRNVTIHDTILRHPGLGSGVRQAGAWQWPLPKVTNEADYFFKRLRRSDLIARWRGSRAQRLARLIHKLKPDLIHSLEIQQSGYLVLEAQSLLQHEFPAWIVTNWGSDIYLFGRLSEHIEKIKQVLANCNYYWCECKRDVGLAYDFGFRGEVLPVTPIAGGLDLDSAKRLRESGPISDRRLVVIKGYQSWAGRALVALRALELCADAMSGYRVAVYLPTPEVKLAAELASRSIGIPIDIVSACPHTEILRLHGRARISIGLSISDAISQSFLEAIAMGSFPIQSFTACVDEWARDGETALFVHPEDPQAVAVAIRRAIADDKLVDRAAEQNALAVTERLDAKKIQPQVVETYRRIARSAAQSVNTQLGM